MNNKSHMSIMKLFSEQYFGLSRIPMPLSKNTSSITSNRKAKHPKHIRKQPISETAQTFAPQND